MQAGERDNTNFYEKLKERVFRQILKSLNPGERVLDVGCGDCQLARYLAGKGNLEVVGIDKNGDKLIHALDSLDTELKGKLHCLKSDAEEMARFTSESFSSIVSMYSLHEFSDVHRVLEECMRILEGGGKILVVDFLPGTLAERLWAEEYYTQQETREMIERAGFQVVKQRRVSAEGPLMTISLKTRPWERTKKKEKRTQ